VVREFIYPAFQKPPTSLTFHHQFAFRPTGSTTAAIITLFHKVTHLLLTNPYVIVIALDFSKAFDTVRHHTLIDKMAQLDLPDHVHNWLVQFFEAHSHQTKYQDEMSVMKTISASIIQGSAIGPASYVVNSSDLNAVSAGNELCKYADDTYVIIPAVNVDTRSDELYHISEWARNNNLKLNLAKSQEIIFVDKQRKQNFAIPSKLAQLQQVDALKILGVTVTNGLSVSLHIQAVISSCAQTLYALRVLRAHGLHDSALQNIYRSVILAKLLYASSPWVGFTNATDRQKLQAFLNRSKRSGFCDSEIVDDFATLCSTSDKQLLNRILNQPEHVLHSLLPPPSASQYNLHDRPHNRQLCQRASRLTDCNFITRMLYCDMY